LPGRNGAHVQYGNEIRFYADANHDGRAEGFTRVLDGFGIEDSHLFPHQFTRAPGGWLWLAQGAFNFSEVRTSGGGATTTTFNRTKMARWRPDGSQFEIIGWGPCNIWGLVLDRHGEAFIQEANDQGWPLMPFLEGASYPLCGEDVPRSYAPPFPKVGGKPMGGTGLSGLALSEGSDSFPGEWRDVFFINNPITRKVQAIRVHRDATSAAPEAGTGGQPASYGNGWHLEHLPDFLLSSDPWFRPVAMAFGPDGCLYLVDWYNQIISHNEVPRRHPERDRTRGRLWRIRHASQPHRIQVPNVAEADDARLLEHLQAANTWEATAAWQEIVDRPASGLVPALAGLVLDRSRPADLRIRALWCLEGLNRVEPSLLESLRSAPERSVRREALRVASQLPVTAWSPDAVLSLGRIGLEDPDRLVRQESIRWLGRRLREAEIPAPEAGQIAGLLIQAAVTLPASGDPRFGPYFDAFETYLIRRALEEAPRALDAWNATRPERDDRLGAFAAVAQGGVQGARRLAAHRHAAAGPLPREELLLLASHAADPAVRPALDQVLSDRGALQSLYDQRASLTDTEALAGALVPALRALVGRQPDAASEQLLVRLAAGFRLRGLEPELIAIALRPGASAEAQATALRALRESGSTRLDVLRTFALSSDETVRREAITAMAGVRGDEAVPALLEVWSTLPPALRRVAADRIAQSPKAAQQLVDAITAGTLDPRELDSHSLDRLSGVLPEDATLRKLQADLGAAMQPVLRLHGTDQDFVATGWSLEGPFTVETWIQLQPGIGNQDSILGGPDQLDANFYDGRFRVWLGGGVHDIVTATRPLPAESWTHVAMTRDAQGTFRIYLNGALDATSTGQDSRTFENLDIGRSNVPGGTAADLAYYRLWAVCRTPEEIRDHAQVEVPANAPGLVYRGQGNHWGALGPAATIEQTADRPPVMTSDDAEALQRRFRRFRTLAAETGDPVRGASLFATTCGVCHAVRSQGGRIGPALDGAGAQGLEPLLRNILTPNAAMEAGYRRYRVETLDGDLIEGLLAGQDSDSVTLRQPNSEDQRFPRSALKRNGFVPGSVMPEGLLEGLSEDQARDLLAYLQTLR
ncbi:MAG: c-type cytochrome, partial [Verrucomicrobia bacterium]|nr:c-type cytochrome [Verrucomicrobiota bacterium]